MLGVVKFWRCVLVFKIVVFRLGSQSFVGAACWLLTLGVASRALLQFAIACQLVNCGVACWWLPNVVSLLLDSALRLGC